ncbi:hypothetical protein ES703_02487 [subsurface metagenome]
MSIKPILRQIKKEYEDAIRTATFDGKSYTNGNKAKEALIRSQRLINYIHEFIKKEFVNNKINQKKIFPPLGSSTPEIKIKGFLKTKNQDISITPDYQIIREKINDNPQIKRVITVNIRSQFSSLNKNIDTLYERTFAEALNLHLQYPEQCLGEVYMIPTHEYDDKAMLRNQVVFKNLSRIEDYIRMFQKINNRTNPNKDPYKYERICLLIADFRKTTPKVYSNIEDLINDGLVPKGTSFSLEGLTIENFVEDLLKIYSQRFNIKDLY